MVRRLLFYAYAPILTARLLAAIQSGNRDAGRNVMRDIERRRERAGLSFIAQTELDEMFVELDL